MRNVLSSAEQKHGLTNLRREAIAKSVCEALRYMHTRNIVHNAVSSSHILITSGWHARVGGFGSAAVEADGAGSMESESATTTAWRAPEVLEGASGDEKSDVYSFGVVLWELFGSDFDAAPWAGLSPEDIRHHVCDLHEQLDISEGCPVQWYLIMEQCLQLEGPCRPKFRQLKSALSKLHNANADEGPLDHLLC